jgi:uncharacterized membrane protein YqjE
MEENKKGSEKLVGAVADWVETYRHLMGVRIVEHTSLGASVSFLSVLTMVVIVFILLFLGLGAAWWIGEQLDNMKAGFFIVGGVYGAVLIIILAMAKKVLIPGIRNLIIKKIYEQD